jgi:capsid assembly protease
MTEQIRHIYPHILAAILNRPWAIHEGTMNTILGIMDMRADGLRLGPEEVRDRLAAARESNGPRAGGKKSANVAVVPIYGVITPRAGGMESSGSSSVENIRQDFRSALEDEDVDSIVFDIDSPGGVVDGLPELYSEIYEARGTKPMTAVSNTQMASGALWLAAAADRIVASPSATVGSIGVIGIHQDKSEKYAKEGIRHTLIKTSKFKGEGHDSEPLSDDAKDYLLGEAQEYHEMFTEAVAQGRAVSTQKVNADYGQGRMLTAKRALGIGLIDQIDTLEGAVRSSGATVMQMAAGPIDITNHASNIAEYLVLDTTDVVERSVQGDLLATDLPFADRLRLATAELEAVAGIARDRATRRADDGRPLSASTVEHLSRIRAALDELVTVSAEQEPKAGRVASAQAVELLLRLYQEGVR